ncbi:peptide ABC transporter ATP-binding protein [Desulfosarcina ovata subsp. sediminis]|uniref:Peptide ABC transporter ATP-binding protein n=1 Tax=Desulfosarcina ovata subsp. sediminis TaxID=885957 RepID=A0A5K7ZV46_9BACT|nr:ABC transporter ATP-binding protein [Desulfosarcina ovata]BBO84113.1 peptide ABC transporter ATP-binding protein [Desulfosarcina ovata subsp. sediminis]
MHGIDPPILQVDHLTTRFHTRRGVVRAVDDISFAVGKGRVVGLVGESGCGKSMTALSVMGLVPSPPGAVESRGILLNGRNLAPLSYDEMCAIRGRQIAMIFQEPMTALNPVLTVGRQVGEAIAVHQRLSRSDIRGRVVEMFDLVGIPEAASRCAAYPHQLSGGLRQRVMIAMALIAEPALLIADEPTTALDVTIQAQILDLMLDLRARLNTAIIMITHDLGVIAEVCDDVNVMYAGQIVETADVFDLFDRPLHPYTRGLLDSMPGMAADIRPARLANIRGRVPSLHQLPDGCRFHPRCDRAMDRCRRQPPGRFDCGNGHRVRCWLYSTNGQTA